MKETFYKLFWVWEYDKEEKWLNEMAQEGWLLDGVGLCTYRFAACEPGEYTVRLVILLLLAYEEEAYAGIVYHVLYLLFGSGGVERDGNHAHTIGSEVGDEILYGILREHTDSVLRLGAKVEQCVGCLLHQLGKAVVAHLLPCRTSKVLVGEGSTVAILLSLLQGENRKMTSCLHNLRILMWWIDITTYMNMQKYAKKGKRQNK